MQNSDVRGEQDSGNPNLPSGAEEAEDRSLVQAEAVGAGVLRDPESRGDRRVFPSSVGEDRLRGVAEEETPL